MRSGGRRRLAPWDGKWNASSMVRDPEGIWISRSMGQIRDRKVTGGIDLLDGISRSPILRNQPITPGLWNSAVDFALQRDRAAVDRWLEENSDSPIHAQVMEMAERKKAHAAANATPAPN